MTSPFPNLFSSFQLGRYLLQSRIVFAAHQAFFWDSDKMPNEDYGYYLRERAKGGAGLVSIGTTGVHPTATGYSPMWTDDVIPKLKVVARLVHEYPVPVLLQLDHTGRQAAVKQRTALDGDWRSMGPSAMPSPTFTNVQAMPYEMAVQDIDEIVAAYGSAARRAAEGEFDGVEVTVGYGGLVSQFLSAQSNRRTDRYGGKTLPDRMTFLYEVLGAVRRELGPDRLLGVRLIDDHLDYSIRYEEVKLIAVLLERTGLLDYVNAWQGLLSEARSHRVHMPTYYHAPGEFVHLATGLKELVKLPVIGAGRINSPMLAERLLTEGRLDLVGMVRALIADPELPNKAKRGRLDEVRTCLACNQSCVGRATLGLHVTCVYNPVSGREKVWSTTPKATHTKRVIVVGGGPAGMEAARVAAERGHRVTLLERAPRLGGLVRLAMRTPHRAHYEELIKFFERELARLGVDISLNVEATVTSVLREDPESIIVATGSEPFRPEIPGVESSHVVSVSDVLDGAPTGDRVVVLDTQGTPPGPTVAEYLADQGKQVEIVTGLKWVGSEIYAAVWNHLYEALLKKGVKMTAMTGVSNINQRSVDVYHVVNPQQTWRIEPVDTVVLATGGVQRTELYRALKGKVRELFAIGDCLQPRNIELATYDGHKVAFSL